MPDPSPSILKPVLSLLQSPHTGMEGAEGEVQPNKGRDKHQGCCHRGQSSLGPTVQGAVGASVLQSLQLWVNHFHLHHLELGSPSASLQPCLSLLQVPVLSLSTLSCCCCPRSRPGIPIYSTSYSD